MWTLWRPTLTLLANEKVPVVMTTYNKAEHIQTLRVTITINVFLYGIVQRLAHQTLILNVYFH